MKNEYIKQKIQSISIVLDIDNIDTDMIIPKQFLKTITKSGLGKYLFYEQRYDANGDLIQNFPLNKFSENKLQILIAGKNFGCGSSREHAPWALKDFGIRVIIAESFADIFYNNCFENGILPISLQRVDISKLIKLTDMSQQITIDIENQTIISGDIAISFDVDSVKKYKIINNLDQIGETLIKINKIIDFEKKINHEFVF